MKTRAMKFTLASLLFLWNCGPLEPAAMTPPPQEQATTLEAPPLTAEPPQTGPEASPLAGLELVVRSDWGASAALPELMESHGPEIRHVTIHHTAGRNKPNQDERAVLRGIQRFHQGEKSWGDIAYHFLIGPSGAIYQGRDLAFASDTATGYDPKGHLNISLLGNFEEEQPTPEALASLVLVAAHLMSEFDLPPSQLRTHRRVAATLCPGEHLEAWLKAEGEAAIAERVRTTSAD
jgi:hypothetical protein